MSGILEDNLSGDGGGCVAQAYRVLCLDSAGGLIRMLTAHCANEDEAIRKGVAELPVHCTKMEVLREADDRLLWQGTRDEALAKLSNRRD